MEEVGKSEFGKKSREFTEEMGKTAGKARDTLSSAGESLSKSQPMKKVAQVHVNPFFSGFYSFCVYVNKAGRDLIQNMNMNMDEQTCIMILLFREVE